ncbi:hypothetical protein SB717_27870 [Priestia sp. SIMBA_032]|uniref:hypothetical protein n=1 Tax=Priestia sp. SIMBA_032 TaxID=3085775 RepID=UPI00397A53C4
MENFNYLNWWFGSWEAWGAKHTSDVLAIMFGLTGTIIALVGLIALFISLNTQHILQKCRELYWEMVSISYKEEIYDNFQNRERHYKELSELDNENSLDKGYFDKGESWLSDDINFYQQNFNDFYDKYRLYKEIYESEPENFFTKSIIKTAQLAIILVIIAWVALLIYFIPYFYIGEFLFLLFSVSSSIYILYRFSNYLNQLKTVIADNLNNPDDLLDVSKIDKTNINTYALLLPNLKLIVEDHLYDWEDRETGELIDLFGKTFYLSTPYKPKNISVRYVGLHAYHVNAQSTEDWGEIGSSSYVKLIENKILYNFYVFGKQKFNYKILHVEEDECLSFEDYKENAGIQVTFLDDSDKYHYTVYFNFNLKRTVMPSLPYHEYLPAKIVKSHFY